MSYLTCSNFNLLFYFKLLQKPSLKDNHISWFYKAYTPLNLNIYLPPPVYSINSAPFITNELRLSESTMPHSIAIALAVYKLSPVTILTLTPAKLHFEIAPITSYLKISLIPINAIIVNSLFSTSKTSFSSLNSKSK